MPRRRLFVGMSHAEAGGFVESGGDDLQSHRQVFVRKAAGHRDGRQAGEIERIGKVRPQVLFIRVHGFKGFRWPRHGWRGEDIHTGEVFTDFLVYNRSDAERRYVVRRAQKGAFQHPFSNGAAKFLRRFLKPFFMISIALGDEDRLVGFARKREGPPVDIDDDSAEAF